MAEAAHPLVEGISPDFEAVGQTSLQLLLLCLEVMHDQRRPIALFRFIAERLHALHVAQRKRLEGSFNAVFHSMELALNVTSEYGWQRLDIGLCPPMLAFANSRLTGYMPASADRAKVTTYRCEASLTEYYLAIVANEAIGSLLAIEAKLHAASVSAVLAVGYRVNTLGRLVATVS